MKESYRCKVKQNIYTGLLVSFAAAHLGHLIYTAKSANKGHPRERQIMVFIDKWPLFGGYLFYFINEGLLDYGLYLQGGLYSEVAINNL